MRNAGGQRLQGAGRHVGDDEPVPLLWPDVVVEENNLGQAISKLRAALGEAPGAKGLSGNS